jgi:hypothetical protein
MASSEILYKWRCNGCVDGKIIEGNLGFSVAMSNDQRVILSSFISSLLMVNSKSD